MNYLLVSLNNIVSKFMEGIMQQKMVENLTEKNLICDAQHGFRNSRIHLTNMLTYVDDLMNTVDSKLSADMTYLA